MKLLKFFVYLPLFNSSRITQKKICRDCKYFIPTYKECGQNSEINLVTGENKYKLAKHERKNLQGCGTDAKFFEPNKFKIITVPYYFVKENRLLLIALSPIFFSLIAVLNLVFLFRN